MPLSRGESTTTNIEEMLQYLLPARTPPARAPPARAPPARAKTAPSKKAEAPPKPRPRLQPAQRFRSYLRAQAPNPYAPNSMPAPRISTGQALPVPDLFNLDLGLTARPSFDIDFEFNLNARSPNFDIEFDFTTAPQRNRSRLRPSS
jgi:hypothetical protein